MPCPTSPDTRQRRQGRNPSPDVKYELAQGPEQSCAATGSLRPVTNPGKSRVPSGRGFGFSNPPSCMSSKAKETFNTWKEKCGARVIVPGFLDPWGPQLLTLGSEGAGTTARGAQAR